MKYKIRQKLSKTTKKGEYACLKFELRCIEKDLITSKPVAETVYDRILDDNGKLYRVQIKYASEYKGVYPVRLRGCTSSGKHVLYGTNQIDAVVLYLSGSDKLCWIPIGKIESKTAFQIREKPTKNGQQKGVHWAKDYFW